MSDWFKLLVLGKATEWPETVICDGFERIKVGYLFRLRFLIKTERPLSVFAMDLGLLFKPYPIETSVIVENTKFKIIRILAENEGAFLAFELIPEGNPRLRDAITAFYVLTATAKRNVSSRDMSEDYQGVVGYIVIHSKDSERLLQKISRNLGEKRRQELLSFAKRSDDYVAIEINDSVWGEVF